MTEHINLDGEGLLLRIFIGESDHWHGKPLYEAILLLARERGLAGCTVSRALAGFGASSRIHTTKIERLSMDLPIAAPDSCPPERGRVPAAPTRERLPSKRVIRARNRSASAI